MISIIIPFYNEKENLPLLYHKLKEEMSRVNKKYELIFVDDGSDDDSKRFIEENLHQDSVIKLIVHKKKLGKGKALGSGIKNSQGDIIIFMDADLQNDPSDLPHFLKKISEGYEFVNGYRKIRNDGIDKTWPSKIYNKMISKMFAIDFHDINCGYKAMTKDVLQIIQLYGDNYRVLPILAKHFGFRITELPVQHNSRKHGVSKYGPTRVIFGLFDIVSYFFLLKYVEKPLHFFGSIGLMIITLGIIIMTYLSIERIFFGQLLYQRPLLFLGLLLAIVGVQIIVTGFIGELIVYLNHRKDNKS